MTLGSRVGRCLVLVVVVAMLSACGTTSPRRTTDGARPAKQGAKTGATSAPRRGGDSRSGGGGYYKDDGPGSNPPPDLRAIPDATPRVETIRPGTNRPYSVFGQRYVPRTRVEPFQQRGVASWYGRRFHGLPTSSGERYDMYAMTAAHPTLPIPSYVRVTELASGRSVIVRVNDRGPFLHGRIIDLSYTAAWKLGYVNKGSAEVEVTQILPGAEARAKEITPVPAYVPTPAPAYAPKVEQEQRHRPLPMLEMPAVPEQKTDIASTPEPQPASGQARDPLSMLLAPAQEADTLPATETTNETPDVTNASIVATQNGQNLFLQLGVFASRENAESFRNHVVVRVDELIDRLELSAEGGYFRLYAGPYASPDDARVAAERIGEVMGIQPFAVRR
jgi:rare lipoprotein A